MGCNLSAKKGFTLIEILLAMLIASILILGLHFAYQQAHRIWLNAESRRPVYHNARVIIETLRQELSCLYFPQIEDEDANTPFVLSALPDGTAELAFYTLNPSWTGGIKSPAVPAARRGRSRMARVRYGITRDQDSGEITVERFEQPFSGEKAIGKEYSDVLFKGLTDFKIWAAEPDFTEWKESYDAKDRPGRAIKIAVKTKTAKDIPEIDFQASILVPCQTSTK